jgi:hypothetical protein
MLVSCCVSILIMFVTDQDTCFAIKQAVLFSSVQAINSILILRLERKQWGQIPIIKLTRQN